MGLLDTLGSITQSLVSGPEGTRPEYMSIMGVNPADNNEVLLDERTFQWWPETFSDSLPGGWNSTQIPGASHPIRKWSALGDRNISFEIVMSRDILLPEDMPSDLATLNGLSALGLNLDSTSDKHKGKNVDIQSGIDYLRSYMFPGYRTSEDGGYTYSTSPPIALLCLPNVGLGVDGSDVVWSTMDACDVTYNKLFPNGRPKLVTVSLSFTEIVQRSDGIRFYQWSDLYTEGRGQSYQGGGHSGKIRNGNT